MTVLPGKQIRHGVHLQLRDAVEHGRSAVKRGQAKSFRPYKCSCGRYHVALFGNGYPQRDFHPPRNW